MMIWIQQVDMAGLHRTNIQRRIRRSVDVRSISQCSGSDHFRQKGRSVL